VNTVTQNQQTIQIEVLTDCGQTVDDSIRNSDTKYTDRGLNAEDSGGYSGTDRETKAVRCDIHKHSGRLSNRAVDIVTENQERVMCDVDRSWRE